MDRYRFTTRFSKNPQSRTPEEKATVSLKKQFIHTTYWSYLDRDFVQHFFVTSMSPLVRQLILTNHDPARSIYVYSELYLQLFYYSFVLLLQSYYWLGHSVSLLSLFSLQFLVFSTLQCTLQSNSLWAALLVDWTLSLEIQDTIGTFSCLQ